jgi:carboxymethylenebutenolidase
LVLIFFMKNTIILAFIFISFSGYAQSEEKVFFETMELVQRDSNYHNKNLTGQYITIYSDPLYTKDKQGRAYQINAKNEGGKFLILFHDVWGLTDDIVQEAERLFVELNENVTVIAPDLFDGKAPIDSTAAKKLLTQLKYDRVIEIVRALVKQTPNNSLIATIGWGFGGGWALEGGVIAFRKAAGCVMFYGLQDLTPERISTLSAPVFGVFGREDLVSSPQKVTDLEVFMSDNRKPFKVVTYDADRGFANFWSENFHNGKANNANDLALKFLKERLSL